MNQGEIIADASVVVTDAYDDVRQAAGGRAAVEHLREVVKSAAHIAGGQLGVSPAAFLRDIVEDMDDSGVKARERANA